MLSGENPPSPSTPSLDDINALQRSYKDLKTKYEVRLAGLSISIRCSCFAM